MSDITGINVNGTTYTLQDTTARGSIPAASTSTPAALGTAAVGSSTAYARADHVHAKPTAADIGAGTYSKPSGGIPSSDMASAVQTSLGKADTAYQKPFGGIPDTDIASASTWNGKITAPSSPANGAFLVWNGSAWVAQTLSTWQGGNY